MKFETWDLGLLRIFFSAFAILANKMEVVLFGVCLRDTQACTVLPDIAFLTCYAVRTIVLSSLRVHVLNFGELGSHHLQD